MRLVFGSAWVLAAVTLPACSCQALPDVVEAGAGAAYADGGGGATGLGGEGGFGGEGGDGGDGGGGGGELCGTELVDVMTDREHCGLCDNACLGTSACIQGSCRLAPSSDGAWAATMDGNEHIVWSEPAGGPIARTSSQTGSTDTRAGSYTLWDLSAEAGYIVVAPTPTVFSAPGLEDHLPPQWFTWGGALSTLNCPMPCSASDVTLAGGIIGVATGDDLYYLTPDEIAGVTVTDVSGARDFPTTMVAASPEAPFPVAIAEREAGIDWLFHSSDLNLTTLQPLGELVLHLPNALTFVGQDLYWIGYDEVRCRRASDGAIMRFVAWQRPGESAPRQPSALWGAWKPQEAEQGLVYIAFHSGSIVRAPAGCTTQTSVEVLSEPPLDAEAEVFSITGVPGPDWPIYFAQFSSENAVYGGIFSRSPMAKPIRID